MPSIPQSLLWISLVVLWLFVLVPMLVSKRENVRRTSDAALATRVLNGGRATRLLRRHGPAAGHHSDPHWRPSEDELDDHDLDERDAPAPKRTVVLAAAAVVVTESEYLDVEVIDPDTDALPVGVSAGAIDEPELELDLGLTEESNPPTEAIRTVDEADFEADEITEDVVHDDHAVDEADGGEDVEESEAYDAFAGTEHDYEYEEEDDSTSLEAQTDDDVHMAVSMSQARRRRYDSTTAAAVSARKYKFRKRVLMAMTVLMTGLAAASYLVSPALWWVCGSLGIVTLLYLGYLRRQTRIEERVRRRRSQRMQRARLGVENTRDEEFDVVPSRLRRPGAVVLEIDDEDPVFEHLDYAPVARDYDLPRAAGQ